MKLKKFEICFIAVAGAAVFFCVGFFLGRDMGRTVEVTVESHEPAEELAASDPVGMEESSGAGLVNINTADADELDSLPGIGPTLAGRIIEYREENGPFSSIEDILNVYGIGEGTYEEIWTRITV